MTASREIGCYPQLERLILVFSLVRNQTKGELAFYSIFHEKKTIAKCVHPVMGEVLSTRILGVPPAGGPLL